MWWPDASARGRRWGWEKSGGDGGGSRPPAAQHVQQRLGDRHIAILVALTSAHRDAHPLRVDVAHLQRQPLAQTQPRAVEGGEEDPVAELAYRAQQPQGLLPRQHVRQALWARRLDDLGPVPRPLEHLAVEELQTTAVELDRRPGMGLQERREVGLELLSAQVVGAALEEIGATPDSARVGLDGLLGLTLELQGAQQGGVEGVKPGLLVRIQGDTLQQECRDDRDRPEIGRLGEYRGLVHLPR